MTAELLRLSSREEQSRRLDEAMRRQLGEFCRYLDEPGVIELSLNPDGQVFADILGKGMHPVGAMKSEAAEALIATVASIHRTTVTRDSPILECELPLDGSRFEGLLPPVVSAPAFSIRRHASAVFTLAEYEAAGVMTATQRQAIELAVATRRNILITGGTASGKTTLGGAILAHMAKATPDDRVIVLEDTVELKIPARNSVALRTTHTCDMRRLVRAAMRLRPDRLVIGEVRDGAALDFIKALNTGHSGGFCTVHADDCRAALLRMEQLIQEVSIHKMPEAIAQAINVIVAVGKSAENKSGRRVKEILAVKGWRDGEYITETSGE